MAVGTGQVSLSDIETEFGGSAPTALSEYYSKGNAPGSGEIQIHADFQGTSDFNYLGITWSTDDVIPVGSANLLMCGKVGAALLVYGALATRISYEHNGSSWSSSTATGGAKHSAAQSGGSQDAAVVFGGYNADIANDGDTTDEYNGTSWSTVNSMTVGTAYATGGGEVQTAQFVTGGSQYSPTIRDITTTQTYNGTTWTDESVDSNGQGSGCGQNSGGGGLDACLSASGTLDASGQQTAVQLFNKTAGTWTSKAAVSVALAYPASCSDGTRIYKIGGHSAGAYSGSTMRDLVDSWVDNTWTSENVLPVKTITAGWGAGGLQSPGGAFQAGGSYWNGSSKINDSTQYYTAAATT
jgi:hypothetical protein